MKNFLKPPANNQVIDGDPDVQGGKSSELPFGIEDKNMIMQFASAFHTAYLVRRKNHFFLLATNENIPKELYIILKGKNKLLLGPLLKVLGRAHLFLIL
ncbi:hypothetical protein [Brevibacillus reuszeri]|uniref:hypothetical protein n=1 Tax=Brevibacillus reuszeri TaxID=54915 RepID=UPI003D1C73FD